MGIGMCIVGFNVQINTIQVILETILRAIGYDPSNSVVALKDMKLVNQIAGHEIAHENARQSRKARNCTNAWLQKEINSFILVVNKTASLSRRHQWLVRVSVGIQSR